MPDRTQTLSVEAGGVERIAEALDYHSGNIEMPESEKRALQALRREVLSQPEHQGDEIPRDYWREVPCGHPPDPVAMYGRDGEPVCHCGCILDQQNGIDVDEAPGPVVHCQQCGCHVAIPPKPQPPAPVLSDQERAQAEKIAQKIEEAMVDHGAGFRLADATLVRDLASQEHRGEEGRIAKLEALEPDWDSYGGKVPTAEALERLRSFDRALAYVPLADGGVQVEFHALGWDFEAEIDPAGQVIDAAVSPPSDSQGDQERCERCGGSKQIIESVPHGDNARPCPDCNPAPTQVEGEPRLSTHCRAGQHALCEGRAGLEHDCGCDCHWPAEIVIERKPQDDPIRPLHYYVLDGTQSTDFSNACRYMLAPAQVEEKRLGFDLAKKAMREGLRVRVKPSLQRTEIEGVPISIEDRYFLLDPDGGISVPHRLYWNELDGFEILPEQPEGGDEEDWPDKADLIRFEGDPPDELRVLPTILEGRDTDLDGRKFERCRYLPATSQDSSGLEERVAELEEIRSNLLESWKVAAASLRKTEDRASKAEAERDAERELVRSMQAELERVEENLNAEALAVDHERDRAGRYENALEELAAEFERRADAREQVVQRLKDTDRELVVDGDVAAEVVYREAASLAREKAAKLKVGE